jgi:integrase
VVSVEPAGVCTASAGAGGARYPTRRRAAHHASIALASGEPITVVSRRLGHAAISITLDVYGHCLPADDGAAAASIAAAILGGPR